MSLQTARQITYTETLDNLVMQRQPPSGSSNSNQYIAFMKVDVEGHEISVLRGAMETISGDGDKGGVGAILVEMGPSRWSRYSISLASGIDTFMEVINRGEYYVLLIARDDAYCPAVKLDRTFNLRSGKWVKKVMYNYANGTIERPPRVSYLPNDKVPLILAYMAEQGYDCNFWLEKKALTRWRIMLMVGCAFLVAVGRYITVSTSSTSLNRYFMSNKVLTWMSQRPARAH